LAEAAAMEPEDFLLQEMVVQVAVEDIVMLEFQILFPVEQELQVKEIMAELAVAAAALAILVIMVAEEAAPEALEVMRLQVMVVMVVQAHLHLTQVHQ
jgi:hypothetical protein